MTGSEFTARDTQVTLADGWVVTVAGNWKKDEYNNQQAKRDGYVWLTSLGYCRAKPLAEFVPGDIMVSNFGNLSQVIKLIRNDKGNVIGVTEAWVANSWVANGETHVQNRKRRGTTLTAYAVAAEAQNLTAPSEIR